MALPPANVADHVAAVTVFANPLSQFGRPLTDWSPVHGVKIIDLCNGADPSALAVMMLRTQSLRRSWRGRSGCRIR
jgi:hypothetical protein